MKNFLLFILFIMFTISCRQDKPADAEVEEVSQTAEELSQTFAERIPQISDEFKASIFQLQESIKINPEDKELREQFCEMAYTPDKMVIVTMGIAKLKNPETGEQLNRSMVERTAQIDATRWALFTTNWLMYEYEPAFTEIKGNFTRSTQVIDKVVAGDSLFLYLASDLSN